MPLLTIPIKNGQDIREQLDARVDMYENDWEDQLDAELRKQFVSETYDRIKLMLDTSMNIFRRIVREICTVYKENSKRTLSVESEQYDALLKNMKLDVIMNEAHRMSKAGTVSFLHVRAIPGTDRIIINIIKPEDAYVETDPYDQTKMKGFAYKTELKGANNKEVEAWVYYTKDLRIFLNASGREIENPVEYFKDLVVDEGDGPITFDRVNKYGIIPIIPFHCTFPVGDFWRPKWNYDAYKANLIIGVMNTYLNYLVKTQSFKQIVLSGDDVSNAVKNGILDPSFPLTLGSEATATTLDLNTRLDAIDNMIRGKVASIANNYGISLENFTLTGSPSSGYSLKVSNRSLEEIRTADIPVCMEVEKELFEVIRAVNNAEFPSSPIQGDAELKWVPGEVEYPLTWEEQEKKWNFEFSNNVSNAIDYMLYDNPMLTREEALEKIKSVIEENKALKIAPSLSEVLAGKLAAGK